MCSISAELLDTAVADRLRTNSAGVLMSGGLDSPTKVAASAQRLLARTMGMEPVRPARLHAVRL